MLFKVLSSFLVLQIFSFALWQGVQAWNGKDIIENPKTPVVPSTSQTEVVKPAPMQHVRLTTRNTQTSNKLLTGSKKKEVVDVLSRLPHDHSRTLKSVILDYDEHAHRGLGGKSMIIMRAINMSTEEFIGVLIHELGHTVDLGHFDPQNGEVESEFMDGKRVVYENDPSLEFYRISWNDHENRKKTATNSDFVSGYAMSDPFEDFAESYVYYVLHNKEFLSLTETSEALLAKYNFMKSWVFKGETFDTGAPKSDNLWDRPWDITVLDYDLEKFLTT